MIMMPAADAGHFRSSGGAQTSGTPQDEWGPRKSLDRDASAELPEMTGAAAQAAVMTGEEQLVDFCGARLRVLPPGSTAYQLRGGVEEGTGWAAGKQPSWSELSAR